MQGGRNRGGGKIVDMFLDLWICSERGECVCVGKKCGYVAGKVEGRVDMWR